MFPFLFDTVQYTVVEISYTIYCVSVCRCVQLMEMIGEMYAMMETLQATLDRIDSQMEKISLAQVAFCSVNSSILSTDADN